MRTGQQLGLDELMIVNPSSTRAEAMFLGEDGTLYQVQGLSDERAVEGSEQCYLGEDGSLYHVQGFETSESREPAHNSGRGLEKADDGPVGHYFLGADGMLYEVVE
jgi:hypothetical protein